MDLEKQETKEKAVAQGFTDELKGTSYCWSASQSPRMVIAILKKMGYIFLRHPYEAH